ncbi:MAG: MaoC family dehydratase N-terminal domain-containing protein [Mycobacteriales bacterium]|nr:MaoC family dehydratase N-terminal domain-containing protein [Frankia sp.]
MALNRELIGRTFEPSSPYEVSREKIREFATAIGDASPAYLDADAARALGHPDVIAPPTFAIVVSFRMGGSVVLAPGLGLDYSRVVHGEQSFEHHRPIHAGDVLVGTPRIDDIRVAGRNELLTWTADIATVDGEPVCRAVNTLVSRGTAPTEAQAT